MAKNGRTVFEIMWDGARGFWVAAVEGFAVATDDDRSILIQRIAAYGRELQKRGFLAQQLVHNKDGRFAFERTYGRDPRGSKG